MAKDFFSEEQQEQLVAAIKEAELNTSGEIRLHLSARCSSDPKDQAIRIFERLKMHQTEQRNGVLIFMAVEDKKFAIIGDRGINEKVPSNFWDSIRDVMQEHFKSGNFIDGLTEGIKTVGGKLKTYFPYQTDDVNELSDDISFNEDLEQE
ncbi:MAG: TPM domain-containing protein [Bacteroidetes bacterium]|nr:MAG: TPM domain-containing protein [Bacteroidota bacterium]